MQERSKEQSDFEKRAAEVFGALDSYTPRHISTRHESRDQSRETKEQPPVRKQQGSDRKRRHPDDGHRSSESLPWQVRVGEPTGEGGQRKARKRHRSHESPLDPTARERNQPRPLRSPRRATPSQAPGYLTHPEQWTRYSLGEDGTEDLRGLSDEQVNRHAAFQFLDEVQKRKTSEHVTGGDDDPAIHIESGASTKIEFRKPKKPSVRSVPKTSPATTNRADSTNDTSPAHMLHEGFTSGHHGNGGHSDPGAGGGGVVRMPEYVVGGRREQTRQRKHPKLQVLGDEGLEEEGGEKRKVAGKALVSLSHLAEEEED